MTLIDRIQREMESDTESRETQSAYLRQAYERAKTLGPAALAALDDAFIALCGYRLTTLQEQQDETDDAEDCCATCGDLFGDGEFAPSSADPSQCHFCYTTSADEED